MLRTSTLLWPAADPHSKDEQVGGGAFEGVGLHGEAVPVLLLEPPLDLRLGGGDAGPPVGRKHPAYTRPGISFGGQSIRNPALMKHRDVGTNTQCRRFGHRRIDGGSFPRQLCNEGYSAIR